MPRYTFRVRRPAQAEAVEETATEDEPTYRDLQIEAKELGIPANQKADELKAALEEHSDE